MNTLKRIAIDPIVVLDLAIFAVSAGMLTALLLATFSR